MSENNPFEIDFDSYIRQGEPCKKEKSIAWAIATGLQQVDVHIQYEAYSKNLEENQNLPVNLPVNKKMTELLNLLKENPFYTYDELAKIMNCTRETVRVNLRKLETRDLICRIGSDKNGHWEIK